MKIGLFFGSFNPFHIGHKVIGSYLTQFTDLNQLWFVVSPQNPLKEKSSLLDQNHRYQIMVRELEKEKNLLVSNIEFFLPNPSYTIDTLTHLQEKNPNDIFVLIMGSDNLKNFHKWKNYKQILDNYEIYVYPRNNDDTLQSHKNITVFKDVPKMEISASFIRDAIKMGKDVSSLIPRQAWEYIDEMNFYK
jgi:nicotinate-nucleotide adenylyltransferase